MFPVWGMAKLTCSHGNFSLRFVQLWGLLFLAFGTGLGLLWGGI